MNPAAFYCQKYRNSVLAKLSVKVFFFEKLNVLENRDIQASSFYVFCLVNTKFYCCASRTLIGWLACITKHDGVWVLTKLKFDVVKMEKQIAADEMPVCFLIDQSAACTSVFRGALCHAPLF